MYYFGCLFFSFFFIFCSEALKVCIHKETSLFFLHSLRLSLIIYESGLNAQAAVFSFCWQYNDIIVPVSSILNLYFDICLQNLLNITFAEFKICFCRHKICKYTEYFLWSYLISSTDIQRWRHLGFNYILWCHLFSVLIN